MAGRLLGKAFLSKGFKQSRPSTPLPIAIKLTWLSKQKVRVSSNAIESTSLKHIHGIIIQMKIDQNSKWKIIRI